MTRKHNDQVRAYFEAAVRDLTPDGAVNIARVLLAPVSDDPGLTIACSLQLSGSERERAGRFARAADRTLFIQRRAFRRYCAALALDSSRPLSSFDFSSSSHGRPRLSGRPDLRFSFSSCRFGSLGAWSHSHDLGVDIEDRTADPGVADLAGQYFSTTEAAIVGTGNSQQKRTAFYRLWCLKEAALKCVGRGLPYGLDRFTFELEPRPRVLEAPPEFGSADRYNASVFETSDACHAVVIRSCYQLASRRTVAAHW